MKRYLLFRFDRFYPTGGWNDFSAAYDTIEEAREFGKLPGGDYYQIVDSHTGVEIELEKCDRP